MDLKITIKDKQWFIVTNAIICVFHKKNTVTDCVLYNVLY